MASAPRKYSANRRRGQPPPAPAANNPQNAQHGHDLDPNAAVFQPQTVAPTSPGMDYNDLMYYNYGSGYQEPYQDSGYQDSGYTDSGYGLAYGYPAGYYDQNGYYYVYDENSNPNNYQAGVFNSGPNSGTSYGSSRGGGRATRGRGRGNRGPVKSYNNTRPGMRCFPSEDQGAEESLPYATENTRKSGSRGRGFANSKRGDNEKDYDNRRGASRREFTGRGRNDRSGNHEGRLWEPEPREERNQSRGSRDSTSKNSYQNDRKSSRESTTTSSENSYKSRSENSRNSDRRDYDRDRNLSKSSGRRDEDKITEKKSGRKEEEKTYDRRRKEEDNAYDKRRKDDEKNYDKRSGRNDDNRRGSKEENRRGSKEENRRGSREENRRKQSYDDRSNRMTEGRSSPRDDTLGATGEISSQRGKNTNQNSSARDSPRNGRKQYDTKPEYSRNPPKENDRKKESDNKKSSNSTKNDAKFPIESQDIRNQYSFDEFDFRKYKRAGTGNEEMESQRGRLVEELMNSTYECMVCCDVIRREVAVWSCGECYHVFHLYCIKKWARSPSALVEGTETGWRCPGCQNVTLKVPNQYLCFCTKQKDPMFSPYETPHSCGEVCSKTRGGHCKHSCNILCHPGPCPSCNASITKSCHCGKTTKTVKCSQGAEIKCEVKCGKVLNCGKHNCTAVCHKDKCKPCEETIDQYCHCGKGYRQVTCGTSEYFVEKYTCEEICGKTLSCGNHQCKEVCHENDCKPCSLSPENISLCPCGKTKLTDVTETVRISCTDPIPNCDKVCDRELVCGPEVSRHRCSVICHQGSCPVCEDGVTPVSCRCEATVTEMSCREAEKYLTKKEEYVCTRRCNRKRQCGKHKCQNPCCNETEHACTQQCGRKLTCGLHRCEEPCHRGSCHTCWNVSFDELTCHCGSSVLEPPVQCGTKPPECRQLCRRRHECEHTVRHACHSEEKCPPCTELVSKRCMGDHELRKNIPCHITEISCGLPCGKPLACKQHKCIKTCHKGPCLNENEDCEQPCKKPRSWCDHICKVPCHPGVLCPDTLCEAKIEVKCVCGNRSEIAICGSGKREAHAKIYQQMTSSAMIGKVYVGNSQTLDINSLNARKRQLECNEECAKLERNRRLALALQIENPDIGDKLGSPNYNDFLKDFAKLNPAFAAEIEKALAELVQNAKSSKYPNRSHSFKPMKRDQRRFIHEIAEFYGCKTQSYDYEPIKSVVATAYKGKCWMPNMTLTASIKRQTQPSAPLPIPHNSTEKDIRAKSTAFRQSTTVLQASDDSGKTKTVSKSKYVDYFDFDEDI